MRRFLLTACLLLWMSLPAAASAQQADSTPTPTSAETGQTPTPGPESESISITYPTAGETLKGSLPITVNLTLPGIRSWELAFSFADNPTDQWFRLASGSEPFSGTLLNWDTTPLTDGDYSLRLRVYFSDASRDVLITPLRVRNYSIDTPTPTATETPNPTRLASPTPQASSTATQTPITRISPTPLPPNPIILRNNDIFLALLQGAGYVGLAFLFFGAIAFLKEKISKK